MNASFTLHIPTLLLVFGSVTLITTILIVSAALFSEKNTELRLWGPGNVSICLGFIVGGFDSLPEVVSRVFCYGFVGFGLALIYSGLRIFVGRSFSWRFVIILSLISLIAPSYFTFIENSLVGRLFSASLYFGVLNILCAVTLMKPSYAIERGSIWLSSGGFIAMGIALFARAGLLIRQDNMNIDFANQIEGVTLFLTSIAQIWISFAFVFMITSRYSKEMHRLSITDSLTGVLNRNGLNKIGIRMLQRAEINRIPIAVIVLDADHFKKINDAYGHLFGDGVLRFLAITFLDGVRSNDVIARFGGEEFVIILDSADRNTSVMIAERLCSMISSSKFTLGDTTISCTVSIGIACSEISNTYELPELIDLADKALYKAKAEGRNRVCLTE